MPSPAAFPFMSLPIELQTMVLAEVVETTRVQLSSRIKKRTCPVEMRLDRTQSPLSWPSIIRVSKHFYKLALPLVYGRARFSICMWSKDWGGTHVKLAKHIGSKTAFIQILRIDAGSWILDVAKQPRMFRFTHHAAALARTDRPTKLALPELLKIFPRLRRLDVRFVSLPGDYDGKSRHYQRDLVRLQGLITYDMLPFRKHVTLLEGTSVLPNDFDLTLEIKASEEFVLSFDHWSSISALLGDVHVCGIPVSMDIQTGEPNVEALKSVLCAIDIKAQTKIVVDEGDWDTHSVKLTIDV